jgi:Fe-S-cluster-containing hydrogenase component 2
MAYVIADPCLDCGSCEQACPNQAIFRAEDLPAEWAGYARIDAAWYSNPAAARVQIDAYMPASSAQAG